MTSAASGDTMTAPGPLDPNGPDLTAIEVAALLRVSPRSVRRWAEADEFPGAVNFHGKWLFPQAVVIAYKARHQR